MPIVVECPRCKTKADMPDSAAGAKGKCRACGAVVHLKKARKHCCSCGMDITHSQRWKDAEENYYCDICWQASFVAVDKPNHDEIATAIIQPSALARCDRCGAEFPATYLTPWGRQNLCARCHTAKRNQRAEEKQAWKEAGDALATKIARLAVVIIVLTGISVLIGVGISQYQDHSRAVEREAQEQHDRDADAAQRAAQRSDDEQKIAASSTAAAPEQSRKITGSVWLKLDDGQTESIALADVLVLPDKVEGDNKDIHDLLDSALSGIRVEEEFDEKMSHTENPSFELVKMLADRAPVVGASHRSLDQLLHQNQVDMSTACHLLLLEQQLRVDRDTSFDRIVEQHIHTLDSDSYEQDFWEHLQKLSVGNATTTRDGRLSIDLKGGKYVLVCRTQLDNKIVYWCSPASEAVEMNNTNMTVLEYY